MLGVAHGVVGRQFLMTEGLSREGMKTLEGISQGNMEIPGTGASWMGPS